MTLNGFNYRLHPVRNASTPPSVESEVAPREQHNVGNILVVQLKFLMTAVYIKIQIYYKFLLITFIRRFINV